MWVGWRDVLRAAGEVVADEESGPRRETAARRYRRRVAALKTLGYFVPQDGRGEAPAGDSVEIVKEVKGRRIYPPGLMIRASARMVEAQRLAEAQDWTRIPASFLLPSES